MAQVYSKRVTSWSNGAIGVADLHGFAVPGALDSNDPRLQNPVPALIVPVSTSSTLKTSFSNQIIIIMGI